MIVMTFSVHRRRAESEHRTNCTKMCAAIGLKAVIADITSRCNDLSRGDNTTRARARRPQTTCLLLLSVPRAGRARLYQTSCKC